MWHRDERNVARTFSGFFVRTDGTVAHADKATALDAAHTLAGWLKTVLESCNVHAEVPNYFRAALMGENYVHAVFESTKGVVECIRLMSGLTAEGTELVNEAFSIQSPILALGPLATESEKSQQEGFANLLVRSIRCRTQSTHPRPQDQLAKSEQDALDILTLISLIHRKLDRAEKVVTPDA